MKELKKYFKENKLLVILGIVAVLVLVNLVTQ